MRHSHLTQKARKSLSLTSQGSLYAWYSPVGNISSILNVMETHIKLRIRDIISIQTLFDKWERQDNRHVRRGHQSSPPMLQVNWTWNQLMAIGSGTLIQGVCEFCSPCQKTEITRQAHEADWLLSSLPKHCQEKGAKRQIVKEMSYLHKMPIKSILSNRATWWSTSTWEAHN